MKVLGFISVALALYWSIVAKNLNHDPSSALIQDDVHNHNFSCKATIDVFRVEYILSSWDVANVQWNSYHAGILFEQNSKAIMYDYSSAHSTDFTDFITPNFNGKWNTQAKITIRDHYKDETLTNKNYIGSISCANFDAYNNFIKTNYTKKYPIFQPIKIVNKNTHETVKDDSFCHSFVRRSLDFLSLPSNTFVSDAIIMYTNEIEPREEKNNFKMTIHYFLIRLFSLMFVQHDFSNLYWLASMMKTYHFRNQNGDYFAIQLDGTLVDYCYEQGINTHCLIHDHLPNYAT